MLLLLHYILEFLTIVASCIHSSSQAHLSKFVHTPKILTLRLLGPSPLQLLLPCSISLLPISLASTSSLQLLWSLNTASKQLQLTLHASKPLSAYLVQSVIQPACWVPFVSNSPHVELNAQPLVLPFSYQTVSSNRFDTGAFITAITT